MADVNDWPFNPNRRRFTWHFRPLFESQFDRSHWWKGKDQSEIEPAAALYELARRHPLVRETWLKRIAAIKRNHRGLGVGPGHPFYGEARFSRIILNQDWFQVGGNSSPPHSLYWTCLFGLKSWAKLDYTERENWKFSAGYLKGLDFRDEDLQCYSINQYAHWRITDERKAALTKKGQINELNYEQTPEERKAARKKYLSVLHNDLAVNPPTAEEWEVAIGNRAVEAYRRGYALLAVAPDLKADKAASVMAKIYRDHLRLYRPSRHKQRARWKDWLSIISEFENDETNSKKKAKSQVFVRYRRALDGIRFA